MLPFLFKGSSGHNGLIPGMISEYPSCPVYLIYAISESPNPMSDPKNYETTSPAYRCQFKRNVSYSWNACAIVKPVLK